MLRFVIAVLAVSYASAAPRAICHSNGQQMTEEQVVNQFADICDRNNDNIIKEAEVVVGFSDILETSLPLPESMILDMDYQALMGLAQLIGFSVERADFIQKWHARFHDSIEFTSATFDAFDGNRDGVWSIEEVDAILNDLKTTSGNGDGIIQRAEFVHYFLIVYDKC